VPSRPLDEPIEDRLRLDVVDARRGVVEMPHHDYARNSFGTINGGVVGLLCDAAARYVGQSHVGGPVTTHGLEIHYLEQTRIGPARTRARLLRADDHGATARVEVIDAGADDTLLAIGVVAMAAAGPDYEPLP